MLSLFLVCHLYFLHTPIMACPYRETYQVEAHITKYAWTGNQMANGEYPYEGAVATSDRTIPLGTKILIGGKEYTVKDRTAYWIWEKKGLVIDIYSEESKQEMLNFGKQKRLITVFK